MCGITGYINLIDKPIKNTSTILNMLRVQKHRGPDDTGIRAFNLKSGNSVKLNNSDCVPIEGHFDGILGFNRLSILDLSINGHQPMVSPDENVILTLNGEIYNAFDFKKELKEWGFKFKSTSDTEIVLALYLKYGLDGLLNRLNGMYAIVIVDLSRKSLTIIRDRFGIKPMYYVSTTSILAFSSELKSFKFIDNFNFSLFEENLDEYLLFRNNLKGTLFKDIQSLEPGHYLAYTANGSLTKKRYFNINNYNRTKNIAGDIQSYGDKLEKWLSKSVQSQLMSDVKLGCQLSGGIDSSLVTWLANRNTDKGSFEAVSITFDNEKFNEERFIDQVSNNLSITSHKFLLSSDYYLNNIENVTWHLEAPINHPNTVGIYKLSQRAKDYVTVLLSGEGADEVFGGYNRFYDTSFPFQFKRILNEIAKNIYVPGNLVKYMDPNYRAVMANSFMSNEFARKIRTEFNEVKVLVERISLYKSMEGSLFDKQVKYEINSYLPDLLIRQDKMSMAHSIENRVPFLDNEVVENSFRIPEEFLLLKKSAEGYNNEKYLLKKMTANIFGVDFAFRNKMGFGIPLREFFLNGNFRIYLNDKILPGIQKRGLFNHSLISGWLSNISKIKFMELEALWVIISFEIWASVYLDNNYENRNT